MVGILTRGLTDKCSLCDTAGAQYILQPSLACLPCQAVQRTQSDLRSSFSSQEEQRCGTVAGCWSKKNPQQPPAEDVTTVTVSTRVAPVPSNRNINSNEAPVSPRLTRGWRIRVFSEQQSSVAPFVSRKVALHPLQRSRSRNVPFVLSGFSLRGRVAQYATDRRDRRLRVVGDLRANAKMVRGVEQLSRWLVQTTKAE
eukprot:Gb_11268 [translate_table: standard]